MIWLSHHSLKLSRIANALLTIGFVITHPLHIIEAVREIKHILQDNKEGEELADKFGVW